MPLAQTMDLQFHNYKLVSPDPMFRIPIKYSAYTLDTESCWKSSENEVVMKFVRPGYSSSIVIKKYVNTLKSADRAQEVLRELTLRKSIKHVNIVKVLDLYRVADSPNTPESYYVITKHAGDKLNTKIEEGRYSMDLAKEWIRQLLRAVQTLHSYDVIHGNLHPRHICINARNILVLTSFGTYRIDAIAGCTDHKEKVDVQSAAAILCALITGSLLFTERDVKLFLDVESPLEKGTLRILREQLLPDREIKDSDITNQMELNNFLNVFLTKDSPERITAMDALYHPFLMDPIIGEQAYVGDDEEVDDELIARIYTNVSAPSAMSIYSSSENDELSSNDSDVDMDTSLQQPSSQADSSDIDMNPDGYSGQIKQPLISSSQFSFSKKFVKEHTLKSDRYLGAYKYKDRRRMNNESVKRTRALKGKEAKRENERELELKRLYTLEALFENSLKRMGENEAGKLADGMSEEEREAFSEFIKDIFTDKPGPSKPA